MGLLSICEHWASTHWDDPLSALQEAYNAVVRYFGESPKTTPPSVFFPVFVRFIRSYKVS